MAYIAIYITISYLTANKKDWVTVCDTPYNSAYVREIS